MNLHRNVLIALCLLAPVAPLTAHAEINLDDDGDGGGGTSGGGGGTQPQPGTPTWSKSYSKADSFGNSDWGAGYKINGSLSATPKYSTYNDKLAASMTLETYAKLDGSYLRLVRARATGNTEAKKRTEVSLAAYAGPATIWSKTWASTTSTHVFLNETPVNEPHTFIDKTVNVSVFGLPVSFRAKATGLFKVSITGKISNVGLEAAATPIGKASLYTSAAIGGQYCAWGLCVGVTAGVYSDVTLVEASAPAKVSVWWSLAAYGGVLLNYLAKADATIKSLDGEAGVFAEACLGGCISEHLKLIDWTGFTATYAIANMSGSYCLAGMCFAPTVKF
jgi:hypothetical protein